MNRTRTFVLALMAPVSAIVVPPQGAEALAPTIGIVAIEGVAEFDKIPCPPPPPFGTGPCTGSFIGSWNGQAAGVVGTSRFETTWVAPSGSIGANFVYSELQCLALEGTVGIAKGTATASAAPGQVDGQWHVLGETFARDVVAVSAGFDFQWTRIGTGMTLVLTSFSLALDVAGLGPQQVADSHQLGVAVLAVSEPVPTRPPTCAEPLIDVKAQVVASVAVTPRAAG